MRSVALFVGFAAFLAALAYSPATLAQKPNKKKKGTKPAATATVPSASTSEAAPPPPAAPPSSELPTTPPVALEVEHPSQAATFTAETPGKTYYFVGIRYRGTVIPQFLVNLFVNEGATFYSHTIGAELDVRKGGQSTIPWLAYTSYGFGDTLFEQKGADHPPSDPNNWTVVNSSLGALFIGVDEMWSTPLDAARHFDFEYGFGVGVGFVIGSLRNDWVYPNPNGSLHSSAYGSYSECQLTNQPQAPSCNPSNHTGADVNHPKVGGYVEPTWLDGGMVPVIFPSIVLPQLGIRYKPVKAFEARLDVGFSLTGFWFGISADYGLEKSNENDGATTK
jgi:hypothetical protein